MKPLHSVLALERILAALERELLAATDDEILSAAKELGMNPAMKGSAAFFGIRYVYLSERSTGDADANHCEGSTQRHRVPPR